MIRYSVLLLSLFTLLACASESPPLTPDTEKRIALTYDDAPRGDGRVFTGVDRTEALIEQLATVQTGPVAIFVTTQGLGTPDGRTRIEAYAAAGHQIANHSHTHPWASRTDREAYIADIDRAEAALKGFDNRRPWFRFPYLDEGVYGDTATAKDNRDALRSALADRHLISAYVTVDTYDWHLDRLWQTALKEDRAVNRQALAAVYVDMVVDAAEHYHQMALNLFETPPAQVLLLHENDLAASFTIPMVKGLREAGWTIIDPDEAYADPIATTLPQTLFSGMGRIAALARDAGTVGADSFDHWSASESGIEARLTKDAVFTE